MTEQTKYLIVDWGTTNFRAFAMGSDGQVLSQQEKNMGLLNVENGEFALALESVLSEWLEDYKTLPIFMAGMVGSMKGWINVDYAATKAGVSELIEKAHKFILPWGAKACIVPGVCHHNTDGVYDVMRGEEVQILGLAKLADEEYFQVMLPGTHNKHVNFKQNKIESFASFLTGELYSVITNHMLVGKGLDPEEQGKHPVAFYRGIDDGVATEQLSNTLFRSWTHRLFQQLEASEVLDYISGLLIGNELKNLNSSHYYLVGGSGLCRRYQQALDKLGIASTVVSGNECFIAGMNLLCQEMINE